MFEKLAHRLGFIVGSTTVTDFITAAMLVAVLLTFMDN